MSRFLLDHGWRRKEGVFCLIQGLQREPSSAGLSPKSQGGETTSFPTDLRLWLSGEPWGDAERIHPRHLAGGLAALRKDQVCNGAFNHLHPYGGQGLIG
nr:uncharacterized protein LOC129482831 isoform X2 [Symphalangus syndactylus]